jgi:hypothetical protein
MTSYPFKSAGAPARGPWPQPSSIEYSFYIRGGAATAGDVYQGARLQGDDANVTFTAGAANIGLTTHIMANVVAPTATGILHNVAKPLFGVSLRSAADDTLSRLCLFGFCSAFVIDAAASVAIGDPLVPTTAKNLNGGTPNANEIILAEAQEVMTTPTSRTLGEVLINGVGGFCNGHHDSTT